MRVEVVWNRARNKRVKAYTVRTEAGQFIAQVHEVWLKDAEFVIDRAGQEEMRRKRRPTTHAVVRGERYSPGAGIEPVGTQVIYDPYLNDTFVTLAGETVERAGLIYFGSQDFQPKVIVIDT